MIRTSKLSVLNQKSKENLDDGAYLIVKEPDAERPVRVLVSDFIASISNGGSDNGGSPPIVPSVPVNLITAVFGISLDNIPESAELIIPADNGVGTINMYVGSNHFLIARIASEPDIMSVLFSDDSSQTNQIGAFTKYGNRIIPQGETEEYNVWVTNQNLTNSANVIMTVS